MGVPGPQGPPGPTGNNGATGPTGPAPTRNSIMFYSNTIQPIVSTDTSQNVSLEQAPVGPPGNPWSIAGGTNMTSTITGEYQVTYKLDYFSGTGSLLTASDTGVYLALNGVIVPGSGTLVTQPDGNHAYNISNTIIVDYTAGQVLTLNLLTNRSPLDGASIGSIIPLGGDWIAFQESTATVVITGL